MPGLPTAESKVRSQPLATAHLQATRSTLDALLVNQMKIEDIRGHSHPLDMSKLQ